MVIVQEIITSWRKRSRGAIAAKAREEVPDTLELPLVSTSAGEEGEVIHHVAWFGDSDTFKASEQSVAVMSFEEQGRLLFGCIRIYPVAESVRVEYVYDMGCGGAPERTSFPRQVLSLAEGEWGQVIYNGRFSEGFDSEWLYRRRIVNVRYAREVSREPFQGKPVGEFKDLRHLR
ncbi:MAG: hypothetical protein AAF170_02550 [Bacteroidota bacterium]